MSLIRRDVTPTEDLKRLTQHPTEQHIPQWTAAMQETLILLPLLRYSCVQPKGENTLLSEGTWDINTAVPR